MACGCNGNASSWYYEYELAQEDGSTQQFATLDEARAAQAAHGGVVRTVRLLAPLAAS